MTTAQRRPPAGRAGLRLGPIGVPWRPRALAAGALVLTITLALAVWSLASGTVDLGADRVLATLFGFGDRIEQLVVESRLGRVLAAVLVGFLLGTSGALTQTITRNPIASPDVLGVTTGGAAFAVSLVVFPQLSIDAVGRDAVTILAPAAVLGSFLTAVLVLGLAWRGGFDGLRLVLVGVGVNAVALALISWLLTRASSDTAAVATHWLAGSIGVVELSDSVWLAPLALVVLVVVLRLTADLGALRLGRDVASGIGVRTGRTELTALAAAIVAAGATVAVAGPIGFIAFVSPQLSLRLFGTAGPTPVAAGLVGACLLLAADMLGQSLPTPLPVGVVTAALGAPVLMYLLTRQTRRSSV